MNRGGFDSRFGQSFGHNVGPAFRPREDDGSLNIGRVQQRPQQFAFPRWLNEGLASLYEAPSERNGRIIGRVNWRLPNLQRQIRAGKLPAIPTLLATTRDGFYDAGYDSYAFARYLLLYLQEHDKLLAFYRRFLAEPGDLTGKAALEAVLEQDLRSFEPMWRAWVLALRRD